MSHCENVILLSLRFLDMAKFTTITPLSLLISCKLSFQIVGLRACVRASERARC
jgi:hypothetical protein